MTVSAAFDIAALKSSLAFEALSGILANLRTAIVQDGLDCEVLADMYNHIQRDSRREDDSFTGVAREYKERLDALLFCGIDNPLTKEARSAYVWSVSMFLNRFIEANEAFMVEWDKEFGG